MLFALLFLRKINLREEKPMSEPRKPIGDLRKELKKSVVDLCLSPSQMKKREDIEQMIDMYGKFAETKRLTPLPERSKGGRPKAKDVTAAETDGIAVPIKPLKETTEYAKMKEKMSKAVVQPRKVVDETARPGGDRNSAIDVVLQPRVEATPSSPAGEAPKQVPKPRPQRALSDEQKAKIKAGREANKQGAPASSPRSPPSADSTTNDSKTHVYKRLPVFRLG